MYQEARNPKKVKGGRSAKKLIRVSILNLRDRRLGAALRRRCGEAKARRSEMAAYIKSTIDLNKTGRSALAAGQASLLARSHSILARVDRLKDGRDLPDLGRGT